MIQPQAPRQAALSELPSLGQAGGWSERTTKRLVRTQRPHGYIRGYVDGEAHPEK